MEVLRESTAVTETGNTTIAGPYISPERTESIPLKGSPSTPPSGILSRLCQSCLGFVDDDAGGGGLKLIISTFFILSVAVTVALIAQIYQGDFQVVPHGSVATDSRECSLVGTNILKKDGNAVDAAVASTLCMGVVNFHTTGIGGGGFMLVYDHRRNFVVESLDFRETAPTRASFSSVGTATLGPSAVGVPGLLKGLFAAHQEHGRLSWKEVVAPAVEIAKSGFHVPTSLVVGRDYLSPRTEVNAKLHDLVDSLEAGQILTLPTLAATLESIAEGGPDVFYNGSLSKQFLSAVQGSALTANDLAGYQPEKKEPLHGNFAGFHIIVPGAPSGGPLLLAALESVAALNLSTSSAEDSVPLMLYRAARAIQQNYPGFFAESGDPNFSDVSAPDLGGVVSSFFPDTVASHVAAADLNDLYVSVVSGHNSVFGSQILSDGGYILNNALSSFDSSSTKPSTSASSSPTAAVSYPSSVDSTSASSPKVAPVPVRSIEVDHGPSEVSHLLQVEHRDLPEINLPHLTDLSHENTQNPESHYDLTPLSIVKEDGKRRKRSDNSEAGPRAAIWGSSAANNRIAGGKRPISLSTPVIAIQAGQTCGRRLVLGGSDAGVAAQVLAQLLLLDGNITSSIEAPRVILSSGGSHLALEQWYAALLSPAKQLQLSQLRLEMQTHSALNPSINIVEKVGDTLTSHSDSRGEGVASRF